MKALKTQRWEGNTEDPFKEFGPYPGRL